MILPKGGVNWKTARANLPPTRAIWVFLTRTRFLLFVGLASITILLWRGVSSSAGEMKRLVWDDMIILYQLDPDTDFNVFEDSIAGDLRNRRSRCHSMR
jgi:hypothetical protein